MDHLMRFCPRNVTIWKRQHDALHFRLRARISGTCSEPVPCTVLRNNVLTLDVGISAYERMLIQLSHDSRSFVMPVAVNDAAMLALMGFEVYVR